MKNYCQIKTFLKKFEGGVQGFDAQLHRIISVKGAVYTKNGEKLYSHIWVKMYIYFINLLNIVIPVLVDTLKTFLNLKFGFLQYRLHCWEYSFFYSVTK